MLTKLPACVSVLCVYCHQEVTELCNTARLRALPQVERLRVSRGALRGRYGA